MRIVKRLITGTTEAEQTPRQMPAVLAQELDGKGVQNRTRGGWPQHPKTETSYPSKIPSVTPYELPKYFLWDTPTARKGRYRSKNRMLT